MFSLANLISKSFHPLAINEQLHVDIHTWREVIRCSVQSSECFENYKDLRGKDAVFFYSTLNLMCEYLDLNFTFYLCFDWNNVKISLH